MEQRNDENRFLNVCNRLRRNDPELTFVDLGESYPYRYAPILGAALLHNNNNVVTTLGIDVSRLYGPIDDHINNDSNHYNDNDNNDNNHNHNNTDNNLCNNNQGIVTIVPDNQEATTTHESGMVLLLQYIGTSTSLQTVYIEATEPLRNYNIAVDESHEGEDDYLRRHLIAIHELMMAVARSPNIVEIVFGSNRIEIPSSALVQLLQSTTSLTALNLDLSKLHVEDDGGSVDLSTMMHQSFGSNTTLRRVELSISVGLGIYLNVTPFDRILDLFQSILQSLQRHPRLQELYIVGHGIFTDYDVTVIPILVSQFLLPHNRLLKKLKLSCFSFKQESLQHLLHVGMNSNPQLTALTFTSCQFDENAIQTLIDYFHHRADDTIGGCCVQRLCFDDPTNGAFGGPTNGQFFAALVSVTPWSRQHQQQQLVELHMQDGTEFFQIVLAASNGEYRLPRCIRLAELSITAWEYIQQYLVNHVDLQELVVSGSIDDDIEPRAIVDTICRNGTLQSMTVERTNTPIWMPHLVDHVTASIFDPAELRLVNAYCQRNQQMAKKYLNMSCEIPTFFYIVRPAHRMAPTTILQMLLALDDCIGLLVQNNGRQGRQ